MTQAHRAIEFPPIEMDFELDFQFESTRKGHEYWRSKCADRAMPDRRDIDPVKLVGILKHLSLFDLDIADGVLQGLRARLIGEEFGRVFGSLRNRDLPSLLGPIIFARWMDLADNVLARGMPLRATGQVIFADKKHLGVELMLAPLTDGGKEPAVIMLVDHFYSYVSQQRSST